MRIVSKTFVDYTEPVAVFDLTNEEGNDNFALGNGVVVHNCLKNKPEAVLLSEEVLNILAMIGFDPNAANPYDKLRVGKIISLADPDPDGPLHGDTQLDVATLNPSSDDSPHTWHRVTMRELASAEWQNRRYYVNAWDGRKFVLAEAFDARITAHTEKQFVFRMSNDTRMVCAANHNFALFTQRYDARIQQMLANGLPMLRAEQLRTGDRLCAAEAPEAELVSKSGMVPLSIVKLKEQTCGLTPWYCLTVPTYHNFVLANGVISKNCHINSLIMALLFKFLPDLFKRGLVYVAKTPEFYALSGKTLITGATPDEVEEKLVKAKVKARVNHIKGYGEVDPDHLRVLAFDPASRNITRISSPNALGAKEFEAIMGEGTEARRILLGV